MKCPRCFAVSDGGLCPGCGANLGRELAEVGMQRAVQAASVDWVSAAEASVDHLIAQGQDFTTDDVWRVIGPCGGGDPRALGAIMRKRSKERRITKVGLRESMRPECHSRPITVWRPC